ncbi:FAD-dependent monooxygenase [Streptomyces longispororuber]|uniref:FAD-dependent monooxygenase n=1 Tax=Streptomyces longispororuber TaxID=68230 RepID=UPI00210E0971|nr:FAD-dependent monooxygenase [Streptomyces longispororuber]MCQ4206326.1 FAD-dependent monooxygenase [Streptomyces longispororuber]
MGRETGASVAVVGGSIAGCAAALAVRRGGIGSVTLFERAEGALGERGVGVALHNDRYAELAASGYVDAGMPWVQMATRRWYVRDDHGDGPLGRRIWSAPFPFRTYNWGPLWRELRRRVPSDVDFRSGAPVREVTAAPDGAGALVRVGDRAPERFDLVVGADGYRSVVRAAACGATRPVYAGYAAWRGAFPVERLGDPGRWPEDECAYVVFPGGHLVVYRIPDPGTGGHRANWVLYTTPPPGHDAALTSPTSLPPGTASDALRAHLAYVAAELLPPYWGDLVRLTTPDELILQPLYDFTADRYTAPGMLLIGDAATVARPHTGAGSVKALQDATALEAALTTAPDLPAALAAYDADRAPAGRTMVDLGRRLGHAMVESTPDWRSLDAAGLAAWWQGMDGAKAFGGRELGRGARATG